MPQKATEPKKKAPTQAKSTTKKAPKKSANSHKEDTTQHSGSNKKSEYSVKGDDLLKKIKEILHEGNVRRIVIKDDKDKTYLEIPINVGVVGALIAPVLAAIGALAALVANFKIEVIRKD